MKVKSVNLEAGTSRLWNGDVFAGTAVIYAAMNDDMFSFQCDYTLETLSETRPAEVRALRQNARRPGLNRPKLRDDQLHGELVLIFGPEMSAKEAVKALESLAKRIKQEGLLTGKNENDEYVFEQLSDRVAS